VVQVKDLARGVLGRTTTAVVVTTLHGHGAWGQILVLELSLLGEGLLMQSHVHGAAGDSLVDHLAGGGAAAIVKETFVLDDASGVIVDRRQVRPVVL
jgi:hypothetical protein